MNFILVLGIYYLLATVNSHVPDCNGVPENYFLEDILSCTDFFVCVNGQPIPGSCGYFHFNQTTQTCVFEEDSDCTDCPEEGLYRFPTRICREFIQCFAGAATVETCPEGLVFDEDAQGCVLNSNCVDNLCPPVDIPNQPVFIPNEHDCASYFVCTAGEMVDRFCQDGLLFNPDINLCDLPQNVYCPNGEQVPPPGEPGAVDCPASGVALVPHPTDCNQFYICTYGTPNLHACAEGYEFDSIRLTCDIPELAICYGASS